MNPNQIQISPEGLEVANAYLVSGSLQETAKTLHISVQKASDFLNKSEVKRSMARLTMLLKTCRLNPHRISENLSWVRWKTAWILRLPCVPLFAKIREFMSRLHHAHNQCQCGSYFRNRLFTSFKILDKTDIERIRLSSIECTRITKKLVDIISSERRIAPHLHVPLQSGNNAVLKRMGRNYSREKFASTIENFAQKVEDVGIGADIIVGFPGETDHEFEESVDLINSLPITYLHVFRYSPRPGTAAAEMPDQVHNETKRERMEILRALHEKLREKFAKSQFGKTRRVIIESVKKDFGYGWTGNYMRAEFPIDSNKKNKMILVKPISYSNGIINCRTIDSI